MKKVHKTYKNKRRQYKTKEKYNKTQQKQITNTQNIKTIQKT